MTVGNRTRADKAKPRAVVAQPSPAPPKPVQARGATKPKVVRSTLQVKIIRSPFEASDSAFPDLEGYFRLVERFPLQPIRDDAHLDEALATVEGLMNQELDAGSESYLAVLVGLVKAYEREAIPIPDASEGDVLELLMEQRGVSQTELQREVGIAQSTVSAVLKGTRKLTKAQVVGLARFFHVNPAVFLPKG